MTISSAPPSIFSLSTYIYIYTQIHPYVPFIAVRSVLIKGGTLPAVLRRLTSIETTASSEIWNFLLRSRSLVSPFYIIYFLMKRYFIQSIDVDNYAESIFHEYETSEPFDDVENEGVEEAKNRHSLEVKDIK